MRNRIAWRALAIPLFLATLPFCGVAQARTVSITVQNNSGPWAAPVAMKAARSAFEKAGYQVVESGPADVVATVTVEQAASRHRVNAATILSLFIGGLIDLWNYDVAHSIVSSVTMEGGQETLRHTSSASKSDFPMFAWAQKASAVRKRALTSAVQESLKPLLSGAPKPS